MGGKFCVFGGSVDATFTALESPSRIALDWRFRNWPDGAVSKVGPTHSNSLHCVTTPTLFFIHFSLGFRDCGFRV